MNKNYKVQWSRTKECNVVTSELVGTKGGKAKSTVQSIESGSSIFGARSFRVTLAALMLTAVVAIPTGVVSSADNVVGTITFNTYANTTTKEDSIVTTGAYQPNLTTTANGLAQTAGFIYSNGNFTKAYTGYTYIKDGKIVPVIISPVKTTTTYDGGTSKISIYGTNINGTVIPTLTDNLSYANSGTLSKALTWG